VLLVYITNDLNMIKAHNTTYSDMYVMYLLALNYTI